MVSCPAWEPELDFEPENLSRFWARKPVSEPFFWRQVAEASPQGLNKLIIEPGCMSRRERKLIGADHERFSDLKLWSFSLRHLFRRSAGNDVEYQTEKKIKALLVKPVFRIRKVINGDCEPDKSVAKNLRHFAQDSQRTRFRAYCSHRCRERLIYC